MFDSGSVDEGASDQRGVGTDVRLIGFEAESDEADEPRRSRRTQEQEADLDISADAVSQEKGRIRSIQQNVHPACGSGQIVEGERRIRGSPVAHHEEAPHPGSNGPGSIRIRPNALFVFYDLNNLVESKTLEAGQGFESLPMERDKRKLERLRDRDPTDSFAARWALSGRTSINRTRPFSMRERSVDA